MQKQTRLDRIFTTKKGVFMPYVCVGDPDAQFSKKMINTLIENGAGAIEFGIPFSDPIADGPTIQAASSRALKNGMTPQIALETLAEIRKEHQDIPIIVMTYYNLLYANGLSEFLLKIKNAGADGVIVPDVPFEESGELSSAARKNGLQLIQLVAPTTDGTRLEKIVKSAEGFIYIVSVIGTTGARENTSQDAIELMKKIRGIRTDIPLAIGFGISTAEHARAYTKEGANGIIVGSRLVNIYTKALEENEGKALKELAKFATELSK
ncbi:MAG: tryptophan synthase subunit alpha [Candidatus Bilamarchaeum sp.]